MSLAIRIKLKMHLFSLCAALTGSMIRAERSCNCANSFAAGRSECHHQRRVTGVLSTRSNS